MFDGEIYNCCDFSLKMSKISFHFNPIWTGLFANLKRLGGGQNGPFPPNLAISRQMTMKLGKDILWVEIVTN